MKNNTVIIVDWPKEKKPLLQIFLIWFLGIVVLTAIIFIIIFFLKNKKPSETWVDIALLNQQRDQILKEVEDAKHQDISNTSRNANVDNAVRIQEKIKLFKNLDFEDSKQIKLENLTDEYAYNMNFLIETITNNLPPENPNAFIDLLSILYRNKYFAQNIIGIKDTFYSYLFDRSLLSLNFFSEKEIRDNNDIQCKSIATFDRDMWDFCYYTLATAVKDEVYCNKVINLDDRSDCIFKTATTLWKGEYNPYKDIQSCLNENKLYNHILACFNIFNKQQGSDKSIIDLVVENKDNLRKEDYKELFQEFVYNEGTKDIKICERITEIDWKVKDCEQHVYESRCRFDYNVPACKNIESKEKLAEIYKETFFVLLDVDTDKKYCEQMDQTDAYALWRCWDYFYFKSSKKYSWSKKKEDIQCSKIKDPTTKKECDDWIDNVNNPSGFFGDNWF